MTGNQLPVHFPFCTGARKHFRNQAQYGSKDMYCFWSYSPSTLQRYFRVLSVNITLPYIDFLKNVLQADALKITASELAARCQVFYRKIYGFFNSALKSACFLHCSVRLPNYSSHLSEFILQEPKKECQKADI